jgi:hypothetical protein
MNPYSDMNCLLSFIVHVFLTMHVLRTQSSLRLGVSLLQEDYDATV